MPRGDLGVSGSTPILTAALGARVIAITVAVPTFHRNDDLRELLPMLLRQAEELEGYAVDILVIDNDPLGGAESAVRKMHERIKYIHEPVAGLSAVRNRALSESEGSRLLAFMDDDGRPGAGWLDYLVGVWATTLPAAVAGRVMESYESEPDPWLLAGGFFHRRTMLSGTVVSVAPAGNLMLDLEIVRALDLRFDPRFGLTGGEDTMFTRQLSAAGGRIVWCDESRVMDLVPTSRMNREWVLARSFSHGNTHALVEQALSLNTAQLVRARFACGFGGLARVVAGALRYSMGFVTGSLRRRAMGLRLVYRGAGMFVGAIGHVVEEYARC